METARPYSAVVSTLSPVRYACISLLVVVSLTSAGCVKTSAEAISTTPSPTASAEATVPETTTSPTATPAASASPAAEDSTSFATVADLRAAVESAGVDCSMWYQDDAMGGALEAGWCGDGEWGLSIFGTTDARNHVLALSGASVEPQQFLVGANWLVTRGFEDPADLTVVQPTLGGSIWAPGDALPSA